MLSLSHLTGKGTIKANGMRSLPISTLIAGDEELFSSRTRDLLIRRGLSCPEENQVSLKNAVERSAHTCPELIVVVLSPDEQIGLSTISELTRNGEACVIALGPAQDPQLILHALHSGAQEFVDESDLESQLTEAIVRFKLRRAKSNETSKGGRVVGVLGASGGSGASVIAANLAICLAREVGEACLVDLRGTSGDLASLMDLKPTYTLADVCDNVARLDATMFSQVLARHECGVSLVAAPQQMLQNQKITAKGVGVTLVQARRRFRFTILDLDNALGHEQVEALWQVNEILFVIRLDYTSLRKTIQRIEDFRRLGLHLPRVRIVVNRYGQRWQLPVGEAETALGMKISQFLPDDAGRINQSVNAGVPVVVQCPSAKISRRIGELARQVLTEHSDVADSRAELWSTAAQMVGSNNGLEN